MTSGPVLTTRRLTLRLLAPHDVESVFSFRSDPKVAENTAWFVDDSLAATAEYIASTLETHSEVDGEVRCVWAMCLKGHNDVVGTVDFIQHAPTAGHVHFALGAVHWGRGLATEALVAVASWAFQRIPDLTEILAGVRDGNAAAIRVLEKVGFRRGETKAAPRPPKYPNQVISATTFHLSRERGETVVD